MMELKIVYGVPLERIAELCALLDERGYDLKDASDWKKIKMNFFHIVEKEESEK